ncbi:MULTISPECIES: xanthine dehydrogenase family protein molybdopterin-binding subunit [unclassified Arthrobacter]|uniref:xanthine dehydrogenase family protein molybdopterin-binding subunit n=1 Tax=unclassified Arthrobacter TaxID=235627 RepID=UPI00210628F7|nr:MULTISPECIES: xanthine dehydrogenase family protein molybdopterin-binding subunit [unclassified Arthrobacter]MCQ1946192.1 xanthine dehydrogenase family protein molybdopterin-binding subunit [Arthrobacter sp. zg-Y1116]MCQ1994127.1 xanthine dehydrogenase family protein molybdopterin-binding subunit [Arthrobacter sp. zg-Y1171]UWX81768.1 xanthine dehydrogenase family protein molybdopterin-binding subunit [Arthrobacter sp. zg-Y1171]
MSKLMPASAIGTPYERLDGELKVRGTAPYAYEQPVENPVHLYPVLSTIARGRVERVETAAAEALDGVLTILTAETTPRLADSSDRELAVLQDPSVGYRGQIVAAVLAETPETAREAAAAVQVTYTEEPFTAQLRADDPALYAPEELNAGTPTDSSQGDFDGAFDTAALRIDATYSTPPEHNNPLEPHVTVAQWDGTVMTLWDSTQGVHAVKSTLAQVLGLDEEQVRVIAPHVGGGFGSKGMPHVQVVMAALAAQCTDGRPVKFPVSRQQMYTLTSHRTPTIQHVRLGAADDGRLTAMSLDILEHTSRIKEFAEQTPAPFRMMYAAPNRRTSTRLAPLDIPVPSWMRAPGECPGMFGPEVAMDELAAAAGLDPIELRRRNEPEVDPETGNPFSSRHLLECFDLGAERFGWENRVARPRSVQQDGWLVGMGTASAVYPFMRQPSNTARIQYEQDGVYSVQIGASDIGTGSWTALTQIAADALRVPVDRIRLGIGDTRFPTASVAGGSSGTASWGGTIIAAARAFREDHGEHPSPGAHTEAQPPEDPEAANLALYSFGAHFAEVRIHADTGEIRVPRMLGVFSAGRIINPRTARSQFLGAMTMGLGMALHEQGVLDPRFGIFVNSDLAEYHIPTNADVLDMEALWIEDRDEHAGPLGARGIGEIGIVGSAAAIANAAYNASGTRIRDLPLTPDKFLA